MVNYTTIEDEKGNEFVIMEWIPRMAKEYGWKSELLDESMAEAIEKARLDPEDPWGFQQSLAKCRFSYETMEFCRGVHSAGVIHKGSAYEGEPILAIRRLQNLET